VIRLGKVVGEASPTASNAELAALMVGRAVELTVQKDAAAGGGDALVVDGVTVTDPSGLVLVDDVSFTVRRGEILAIAGVQGNGQTELTEAILGLEPVHAGRITLDGADLTNASVKRVLDAGVGFVPEDRQEDGLVGEFSIAENLMLDRSGTGEFARAGSVLSGARDAFADEKIAEFDIRTPSRTTAAGRLSGGNQQKVVLARELSRDLRLFVAAQPTRGVDVGSIEFIHKRIVDTRDTGVPVIVVSTELDEVTALADRIAVMYRGTIIGIVPADTPRDVLGLMMAGELPAGTELAA
jgi:general nucleoside transport system ATP-binding protein